MKDEKEFNELVPAFYKALNGKSGDSFNEALSDFGLKFLEGLTISILYKAYDGQILFITDSPSNDIGFVIFELFGKESQFVVGSKKQVKARIEKFFDLIN